MLIKKEKIEDLEFMDVEPEDEELRAIVMEDEDKAEKKAEEEYDENVKRVERLKVPESVQNQTKVSKYPDTQKRFMSVLLFE